MSALEEAVTYLRQHLAGGEPVASKDIQWAAEAAGIAPATLRRARERLGVMSYKEGIDPGRWYWRLPHVSRRRRGWFVAEALAKKEERREKPVAVPGDLGGWVAT